MSSNEAVTRLRRGSFAPMLLVMKTTVLERSRLVPPKSEVKSTNNTLSSTVKVVCPLITLFTWKASACGRQRNMEMKIKKTAAKAKLK